MLAVQIIVMSSHSWNFQQQGASSFDWLSMICLHLRKTLRSSHQPRHKRATPVAARATTSARPQTNSDKHVQAYTHTHKLRIKLKVLDNLVGTRALGRRVQTSDRCSRFSGIWRISAGWLVNLAVLTVDGGFHRLEEIYMTEG